MKKILEELYTKFIKDFCI